MASILDIDIDEGATWSMVMQLWEDNDKTLPIDLTGFTFEGAFNIGTSYIPMTFSITNNEIDINIAFSDLEDLPSIKGKYDIEALDTADNNKYRLLQGNIRVNREVTKDQA